MRGDPDDVLLLPGTNLSPTAIVVYRALTDTTQPLTSPTSVPTGQTGLIGKITPMAVDSVAVKVRLPKTIITDQSYGLWVGNPDPTAPTGYVWSAGIKINDARPMWLSPGPLLASHTPPGVTPSPHPYLYTNAPRPATKRVIKVVGRNLQPAAGKQTQVRLVSAGVALAPMNAVNDLNPSTQIERYVAKVEVPAPIAVGNWTVQVSRDGTSWVPLAEQQLTIMPDPPFAKTFDVTTFGNAADAAHAGHPCVANDGLDDAVCVTRANHDGRRLRRADPQRCRRRLPRRHVERLELRLQRYVRLLGLHRDVVPALRWPLGHHRPRGREPRRGVWRNAADARDQRELLQAHLRCDRRRARPGRPVQGLQLEDRHGLRVDRRLLPAR